MQISITVDVPIWRAYACWRRAENFPKFMDSVLEVRQVTKNQLCWVENIDGKEYQTLTEVSDLPSGECGFAWKSLSGPQHWGSIRFQAQSRGATLVMVSMECLSEAGLPSAQALGKKVAADLASFKRFVESPQKRGLSGQNAPQESCVSASVQ